MARDITIKFYRRIGGAAGAPGALLEGEPGYNDNGNTLDIGGAGGATVHRLVGPDRQLELTGTQTVATNAAKTFDVTNFKLLGGASGNILSRGATNGDVAWTPAPSTAVAANAPITGNGLTGTELGLRINASLQLTGTAPNEALGLLPATYALATDQIPVGTDNLHAVTPAGLRSVTGNLATLDAGFTATTIVPALNELLGHIGTLQSGVTPVGTYNALTDTVTPFSGSPFGATPGPLPPASASNKGWVLYVTVAGTSASPNAPTAALALSDQLMSPGAPGPRWDHIPLGIASIAASGVSIDAIAGPPALAGPTVQDALAQLNTRSATALTYVDGISITGLTGTVGAGLTSANALKVGTIDGGTF